VAEGNGHGGPKQGNGEAVYSTSAWCLHGLALLHNELRICLVTGVLCIRPQRISPAKNGHGIMRLRKLGGFTGTLDARGEGVCNDV
jgi:hypothetical protein